MIYMYIYDLQVSRQFRPDFVLIRQAPRDGSRDYRPTLLGLKYGGVPSINSLNSIYQFQVKNALRLTLLLNDRIQFVELDLLFFQRISCGRLFVFYFLRINHGCLLICFNCKDVSAVMRSH